MSSDVPEPKRPIVSPYIRFEKTAPVLPQEPPALLPESQATAEAPAPHKRFSWHRRLAFWALAGGGALSVGYIPQPPPIVHVGTAQPPPPIPQPAWLQAVGAGQTGQPPVQIAQEHVSAAVNHVASASYAPPSGFVLNLPPVQGQLAVHITEQLRSQSEQAIDIVVEVQPQKPPEAQVSEAKRVVGEIGQSFLGVFGAAGLAEAAAKSIRDKGLELAWSKLKHMVKQLKARTGGAGDEAAAGSVEEATVPAESVPSAGPAQAAADAGQTAANPILMRLAESFTILARLFDPTQAGPRIHTIQDIAAALGGSEREAAAILQLGPFVETGHGFWALDTHLGDPKTIAASYPLYESPYYFSWQSGGKK